LKHSGQRFPANGFYPPDTKSSKQNHSLIYSFDLNYLIAEGIVFKLLIELIPGKLKRPKPRGISQADEL